MARVRREPDEVTEWAATSEASPAMPRQEAARAAEPMPAIEVAPAVEVTPAIDVTPAMPAAASAATAAAAAPVVVPLAAAVVAPRQPAPGAAEEASPPDCPDRRVSRRRRRARVPAASSGAGAGDVAGAQPTPSTQTAEPVAPGSRLLPLPAATAAALDAQSAAARTGSTSTKKTMAAKPRKNQLAESTPSAPRPTAVKPIASISLKDAEAKLPAAEPIAPLAASTSTSIGGSAPVTITGCLEVSVDHDEFRLTDTDGAAAPKSRSWRTGFLKKRSAPVALIAPPDAMALQTHVGHRVSATGY